MADPRITLTAADTTSAAFASVSGRFDALRAKATQVSSSLSAIGASVAAIGAIGGLASSIRGAIDLGDQFNKLSQKVGISVEKLSELKFAADLSDVSIEQFQIGMKGLNETLVKANDATSKEAALLKTLGVTARDPAGALRQLSDAFALLPDGATKSALAVELFGKAGMNMIPMLNGGSKALDEAATSARKLGLVMSAETAKAAEEFNDNMTKLGRTAQSLGISLTTKLIGGLSEFTSGLVKAKEEGQLLSKVMADMLGTSLELASKLPVLGNVFAALRDANAERVAGQSQRQQTSADILSGAQQFSSRFGFVGPQANPAQIEANLKKLLSSGVDKAKTGPKDMTLDELRANSALLRQGRFEDAEADADRQAAEDQKDRLDAAYKAAVEAAKLEDEQIDRLTDIAAKNREISQSYLELIDPVEKYRKQLEEINRLSALAPSEGGLTSDQADAAREKVNQQIRELSTGTLKAKSAAEELGFVFTSAFEDAIVGGKKFSGVLKSIGQDIARMIVRQNVTAPLAEAFKTGGAGSNLLGSVGSWIAERLPKFATGGSFTVGGSGGTDSQLVAFKATPGERVDVRTPGQQGGGGTVVNNYFVDIAATVRQQIAQAMPSIVNAAAAQVADMRRRGVAI